MLCRPLLLLCLPIQALAGPWDAPDPFGTSPEALLEQASAAFPRSTRSGTLLRDVAIRIDEEGRTERTTHEVIFAAKADTELSLDVSFAPWHDTEPEVAARLISPRGEVTEIDTTNGTITIVGATRGAIVTDARYISHQLPPHEAGSLLETWVVEREHRAFLGQAGSGRDPIVGFAGRLHALHYTLEAPASVPLHVAVHEMDEARVRSRLRGGRRQVSITASEVAAPRGKGTRWVRSLVPHVAYSTHRSWAGIGEDYTELVADLFHPESLRDWAGPAPMALERDTRIRQLTDLVNDTIRYTGIEFGQQAIVPYAPRTVLDRGFGDCKDQATMLVTLLRDAGISAHLVLLQAGYEPTDPAPLYDPTYFNHAIVYVDGPEPLFIDPTSPITPVGWLPPSDQGRWALIISPDQPELVRTPTMGSEASLTYRFDLRTERTSAEVTQLTDGWAADRDRYWIYDHPEDAATALAERYAGQWAAETVHDVVLVNEHRHDGPLTLRYTVDDAGNRSGLGASGHADDDFLTSWLDPTGSAATTATAEMLQRSVRVDPQRLTHTIELLVPPGFAPTSRLDTDRPAEVSVGPSTLRYTRTPIQGGWSLSWSLDQPATEVTLEQLQELQAALRDAIPQYVNVQFGGSSDHGPLAWVSGLRLGRAALLDHPGDRQVLRGWAGLTRWSQLPHLSLRTLGELSAEREEAEISLELADLILSARQTPFNLGLPPVERALSTLGQLTTNSDDQIALRARLKLLDTLVELHPPYRADPGAAEHFLSLLEQVPEDKRRSEHLRAGREHLLVTGALDELLTEQEGWRHHDGSVPYLAARGLRDGVHALSEDLARTYDGARRYQYAEYVASSLLRVRAYELARAVVDAHLSHAEEARDARAFADDLSRLARWEDTWPDRSAVALLADDLLLAQQTVARRPHDVPHPGTPDFARWHLHTDLIPMLGAGDLSADTALDWLLSRSKVEHEQVGGLVRLATKQPGRATAAFFVVMEGPEAGTLATSWRPAPLGGRAADLATDHPLLLGLMLDAAMPSPTGLRRLEDAMPDAGPLAALAADALMGGWSLLGRPDEVVRLLEHWPGSAGEGARGDRISALLHQGEDARPAVEAWLSATPTSQRAREAELAVLVAEGSFGLAQRQLQSWRAELGLRPAHETALEATILRRQGDTEALSQLLEPEIPEVSDHVDRIAVALATLTLDDGEGAAGFLRKEQFDAGSSRSWRVVVGAVAEAAGLVDEARQIYESVPPDAGLMLSPWREARRRLEALAASTP